MDKRDKLPWWLPGTLFLLVTVALFREFIFSDQMLYGEDSLALGYMARAYLAERLLAGDFPLWAPRLLGGLPFVESISGGDAIYPTTLLFYLSEPYRAIGWKLVVHVLAAGFFMYGWARSLGLGRAAATLGGLAWLLAPVMVTLVLPGNDGKLMVAALAPLVFWAAESVLRRPSARATAALAGAVALTCLTTQYQTSYFLFASVGAYVLFRTVRQWRSQDNGPVRALPALGLFFAGALLGLGLSAVQLLPAGRYVAEASRRTVTTVEATPEEAVAYSSSWSFHPEEVASLIVPEFVGNSQADAAWGQGTYWGRNALKFNHEYLGVTVLAFALFALFGNRSRQAAGMAGSAGLRWFMAGMGLLWLLFALGNHTPVWRIFYEIVPGISLFRVPALAAFLVSFGVTTLFALGIDDLVRAVSSRDPREAAAASFLGSLRGRVLLGFVVLLFLGLLLQSSGTLERLWTTMVYAGADERSLAVLAAASPFITRGFALAFFLAAAAAAVGWAAFARKLPLAPALVVLAGLVALDLGRIDQAFIRTLDFRTWAAANDNTRFLQAQRDAGPPFRVADLRGDDQQVQLAMFGLDLVTGHHPNDLARYRTLLGLAGSMPRGANTRHPNVLTILNVKYLVWPLEAAGGPPYAGASALSRARTALGEEAVYAYPGLERAWFAGTASVMDDEAALTRILSRAFDPAGEAVLAPPAPELPGGGTGTVVWEEYTADYRRLRVRSDGPGVLVVSENWFPGWAAEVNAGPAEVYRVNVTLQAVPIPAAGEHTVTLRFTAPTVRNALVISELSAVVVLALLFLPLLVRTARRRWPSQRRSGS